MMKSLPLLICALFLMNCATIAQDKKEETILSKKESNKGITKGAVDLSKIPYHQIPDYPEKITAGTSIGRIIDGLGYRYYWATKDLTPSNLTYMPGNDGRGTKETLDHLFGLSLMIANISQNKPNIRPLVLPELTWEAKRKETLLNFKTASDIFKTSTAEEITQLKIIFQRGESSNEVPVWHLMNGPIDDAIYHVGQIVSFRRSSGNPMNPFVNVFMGKTKE